MDYGHGGRARTEALCANPKPPTIAIRRRHHDKGLAPLFLLFFSSRPPPCSTIFFPLLLFFFPTISVVGGHSDATTPAPPNKTTTAQAATVTTPVHRLATAPDKASHVAARPKPNYHRNFAAPMEYSGRDGGDNNEAFASPAPRPVPEHAHGGTGDLHAPDPQYDMTGASYEALFLDGGLFSHFINDEDDLGDVNAQWPAYDDEGDDADGGHDVAMPVVDARQPVRLLSLDEAVAALLATCPSMVSRKPATLALERAPMAHVIRRHMRTEGPVDFASAGGGPPCASLAEACDRVEGLGPVVMLERGVVAWLAGRLMERVRPGSSQGVPVGPMSRIGAFVQAEFGDGWTFSHPDQLDARFDEPQHEPLRLLLAWIVDSARTVAKVRDGIAAPNDAAPHRPPNGKDYALGPLRRLKPDRGAYLNCDPHDAPAWAVFLEEQGKPAKRDVHPAPARERTGGARRGRRPLARSSPAPKPTPASSAGARALATSTAGAPVPSSSSSSLGAFATRADKTPLTQAPVARAPQTLPLTTGPLPLPPPLLLSPPPLPAAPTTATQVIAPTALDVTTLDRAVLAQVQSIALMTLSATDPATLASGAHVAFMAPSITCPGAMAFTCWVELPPGTDAMGGAVLAPPPPALSEGRPRKRPRTTRQPRRTKAPAAAAAAAAAGQSTDAPRIGPDADRTHNEALAPAHPTAAASPLANVLSTTAAMTTTTTTTTTMTIPPAPTATDSEVVVEAGPCASPSQEERAAAPVESQPHGSEPQSSTRRNADDDHRAVHDMMIDGGVDQARDTHRIQLDVAPFLPSGVSITDAHNSKPAEIDFERLFAEPGPDEWDELLADGRMSCG